MPAASSAGQKRLPRACKVRVDGGRPESGIDADEQQPHAARDEIVDRPSVERLQFVAGEPRQPTISLTCSTGVILV